MTSLLQDLKYALRTFVKSPGFAAIAVVTLALGIGANTAIFSVVSAVLLKPLPLPEPESLVDLSESNAVRGWKRFGVSPSNFLEWRSRGSAFEGMAVYLARDGVLTGGSEPEKISYAIASSDLFAVLRARPFLGRAFGAEEDRVGGGDAVVLSHGFWKRRYGGDRAVVGRTLMLDGRSCEILGVLPAGLDFPGPGTELWKPAALGVDGGPDRRSRWLEAVARLKQGVSVKRAASEMQTIARSLESANPEDNRGWSVTVTSLADLALGGLRLRLLLLQAFVGIVLAIACANLANLLLARGVGRGRELALRLALGADSARVFRQLLTESVLLAAVGGIAGIGIAAVAAPALFALVRERVGHGLVAIDWRVGAFSLAVAATTAALFGIWPAARAARVNPADGLAGGRNSTEGRRGRRASSALVVAETALAALLLVSAGLLVRSLQALMGVDLGFRPTGLVTLRIEPPWRASEQSSSPQAFVERFRNERRRASGFYTELLARVRALPGIQSAAAVNRPPLGGSWWTTDIEIAGRPVADRAARSPATCRAVTPGYFTALGVPIVRGRAIDERDGEGAQPAAVVDRAMADLYWPGRNPIGERLRIPDLPSELGGWMTIVGVVGNLRYERLSAEPKPTFYVPFAQAGFGFPGNWGMTLIMRTDAATAAVISSVSAQIRSLDPDLPVFDARTMQDTIDRSLVERRQMTGLLAVFSALALLLAAIGLAGVLARNAAARTREFGVRMALGARPGDVLSLVVREGLTLTATGFAIGISASLVATRIVAGELYGVSPTDPATFGAIGLVLTAVGFFSSLVPALRATRIDPIAALRNE